MRKLLHLLYSIAALMVFSTSGFPQGAGVAQITGTVSDSTGALIPGVRITATNTQTGVKRETTTNAQGDYALPLLPVGIYDIAAEQAGFEISRKTGLKLNVGDAARADLMLTVGSTTSTVDVSANAVQLNLENAEVSDVISQRMVADLPLNGRNFTELMVLNGTAYQTFGTPIGQFRPTQGAEIGLSGGRVTSNGYLIDGLNNRDYAFGAPILIPSIDALQEFKLDTKTYSAAYGGTSNQINLHFKSGTNQLHGTAYEFLRNNDFDARSFFDPNTIPRLNQNQFGYSLGGPIFIPKLYDGRNRSFFFANYEGTRLKAATSPQFLQVPTDALWNGQFTSTIIDPLTGLAFPNNQIPANRISQFAKQEHKFAVSPNTTASGYNFVGSSGTPSNADQQNYKFDQNFGSKNAAFFRYSTSSTDTTNGGFNGSGLYGLTTAVVDNTAYQASYTRTFSPTVVNQAQFGHITAQFNTNAPTISSSDLAGFGIQGGFPDQTTPEIPEVIFAGTTTLAGFGVNSNWPFIDSTTYWNGSDNLSIIKGAHTLDIGISVLNWTRTNGRGANLGSWTFNGQYAGDPFADFLLGNPSQIGINVPTPFAPTAAAAIFEFPQYTIAPYVEDLWKVSPRLTLTLGLRYDFYKQAREAKNRYFWLDNAVPGGALCTASKQAIAAGVGQSGLIQYCGANPAPSPKTPFAPRLGLAFRPTNQQ